MRAKYFVLIGIGSVPIFFIVYFLLFIFQLNVPVEADSWIDNAYKYKDYRAKKIQTKKIIIIGGSNALFGINSDLLENITGYPVVNLATHAGLDLDYYYYKLKGHIKRGDIVLIPLEFSYYMQNENITYLFSNNMMSWGKDYLYQLSLIELLNFFMMTEPERVLTGVVKQIETKGKKTDVLTQKEVVDSLHQLWSLEGEKWRGYSYKSLNTFGDINVALPNECKTKSSYLKEEQRVSLHFLKIYMKIDKLVKENEGKLYLTYPVTMKTDQFDLGSAKSRLKINTLERSLDKFDIKLYCNPALFNLDISYFYNSDYHPNKYGALVRSENLAMCLNQIEKSGKYRALSFEQAIKRTEVLQEKYADEVNKL